MIRTILKTTGLALVRDRVALLLTFALPIVFFSVFAVVFSGMDDVASRPVRVALVVEDEGPFARALADQLANEPALEIVRSSEGGREAGIEDVRAGTVQAAIVIPAGVGHGPAGQTADVPVEIIADRSNPLAVGVIRGVLQAAAVAVGQRQWLARLQVLPAGFGVPSRGGAMVLPAVVVDALGDPERRPSVSFFAAGLGVMFLMFAVAGRGSILIEERESGILQRMLAAEVGLTRLLLGRWLFLVLLGVAQVTVMFGWAAVAFGLDLFTAQHLTGFAAVTVAAAAAAAAFGLVLSAACRTRAQLNGVAVVAVLVLSAVGGSLFPSFLMPEGLRQLGRVAFNWWALSGYQKVFWYDRTLGGLAVELAVLAAWTFVLLATARLLAHRWERS